MKLAPLKWTAPNFFKQAEITKREGFIFDIASNSLMFERRTLESTASLRGKSGKSRYHTAKT